MKDIERVGNCNDHKCTYFDETMELNCSYSVDNKRCIKMEHKQQVVEKVLQKYTQFLYDRGYLDDDWIFEAPSPIEEFLKDYKD